jgi:ribosome maturation factor RimP
MKQEEVKPFMGKEIKLVLQNGFTLIGTIQKVTEQTILFQTKTAESLIDINNILSIVSKL